MSIYVVAVVGIDSLVEIVVCERTFKHAGWSNPAKLINLLDQMLQDSETRTYQRKIEMMLDYLQRQLNTGLSEAELKTLEGECLRVVQEKMGFSLNDQVENQDRLFHEIYLILEKYGLEFWENSSDYAVDMADWIRQGSFSYNSELDVVCLVADRDSGSFKEPQYEEVVKICEEKGYRLYVSNPCFEFYLFLHFPEAADISSEDRKKLLENRRIEKQGKKQKRKFSEELLRKHLQGYTKNKFTKEQQVVLLHGIDTAIQNEALYCESISGLKTQIGSNVGKLIAEMRQAGFVEE